VPGPRRSQGGHLTPRLRHHIGEERSGHFRETNEDGGIVSVVLGEEEAGGIELHQSITVAYRPKLQHQDRIVVPEAREKTAIQEEGRHAIRSPL